jgi:uncharacterized protein YjdB
MSSATIDLSVNPTIDVKGPAGQMSGHVWSSSNTSIATVNKGVVTGKSVGNCVISVTCADLTANCNITVKASCTGVSLNKSNLRFTSLDATQTLTTTLTPSNTTDTVSWKSSDTAVATVSSNGVVKAVGYGSCTITASCGSKTATCTITVNNPNPYLVLSAKNSHMVVGEQHTFYADLYNGNIDNLIINLSNPEAFTLTYSKTSSTRVTVTITMLKDEPGAVNFNYNSQLLDRFEIYVRA